MASNETQCIPPPISNLLRFPITDDVNIEEGLCKPQDPNLFLLSSIAFLQKQLLKKIEDESNSALNSNDANRKYSDLLLVESGHKRQKCFIRLPNLEKFDRVLRSEACLPQKVLTNSQILPLPKKGKSNKLSITNIFKQKGNVLDNAPKRSHSVFNLFRKSSTSTKSSEFNLTAVNSVIDIDVDKCTLIKNEDYFCSSLCSLATLSSLKIRMPASSAIIQNTNEEDVKKSSSYRHKELSDIEEEILKVIPTQTHLDIKRSINEKLRVSRIASASSLSSFRSCSDVKFVRREDDFLEDPQTGIKFKCVPRQNCTKPKPNTKRRMLREQQSKLSVCIEDEPESDFEIYPQERKYPFNCTDDVKAIVSSETIDVIMSELLLQLEERIKK